MLPLPGRVDIYREAGERSEAKRDLDRVEGEVVSSTYLPYLPSYN
jgi:hypothetical protein